MAIDTENERRSTICVLPVPSGSVTARNRVQATWTYIGLWPIDEPIEEWLISLFASFHDYNFIAPQHFITQDPAKLAWKQIADGEENDETDWDTVTETGTGTLDVAAAAKKNGSYGWSVTFDGSGNEAYGIFTDPSAETAFTLETWFDPNSFTATSDSAYWYLILGRSATPASFVAVIAYETAAHGHRLRLWTKNDANATVAGTTQTISDDWHKVRLVYRASASAGADDGYCALYVDDIWVDALTGLDTDTWTLDSIRFGNTGNDAGTVGTIYMDDCQWADGLYIIGAGLTARYHDYNLNAPKKEGHG